MHLDLLHVTLPPRPGQPPVLVYCPTCGEVRSLSAHDSAPSDGNEWEERGAEREQDSTAFLRQILCSCQSEQFSIDRAQMWDFLISHQQEEELTIEVRQDSQPCFDDSQAPYPASSILSQPTREDWTQTRSKA
jgi:hypothetical protein